MPRVTRERPIFSWPTVLRESMRALSPDEAKYVTGEVEKHEKEGLR